MRCNHNLVPGHATRDDETDVVAPGNGRRVGIDITGTRSFIIAEVVLEWWYIRAERWRTITRTSSPFFAFKLSGRVVGCIANSITHCAPVRLDDRPLCPELLLKYPSVALWRDMSSCASFSSNSSSVVVVIDRVDGGWWYTTSRRLFTLNGGGK